MKKNLFLKKALIIMIPYLTFGNIYKNKSIKKIKNNEKKTRIKESKKLKLKNNQIKLRAYNIQRTLNKL